MDTDKERQPTTSKRYTKAEIEKAIEDGRGITGRIAAILNCGWMEVTRYLAAHPKQGQLARQMREQIVDKAEEKMEEALSSPDGKTSLEAAKFILKTIGKGRGWTDSPQVV